MTHHWELYCSASYSTCEVLLPNYHSKIQFLFGCQPNNPLAFLVPSNRIINVYDFLVVMMYSCILSFIVCVLLRINLPLLVSNSLFYISSCCICHIAIVQYIYLSQNKFNSTWIKTTCVILSDLGYPFLGVTRSPWSNCPVVTWHQASWNMQEGHQSQGCCYLLSLQGCMITKAWEVIMQCK